MVDRVCERRAFTLLGRIHPETKAQVDFEILKKRKCVADVLTSIHQENQRGLLNSSQFNEHKGQQQVNERLLSQ